MINYVFCANLSMGGGKLLVLLLVILWFVSGLETGSVTDSSLSSSSSSSLIVMSILRYVESLCKFLSIVYRIWSCGQEEVMGCVIGLHLQF